MLHIIYYNFLVGNMAGTRITKEQAIEWLKKNEHKSYLGHGTADRHEMVVRMMKQIVESEE